MQIGVGRPELSTEERRPSLHRANRLGGARRVGRSVLGERKGWRGLAGREVMFLANHTPLPPTTHSAYLLHTVRCQSLYKSAPPLTF